MTDRRKKSNNPLGQRKNGAILESHQASIELTDSQQQDIEKILENARIFCETKGKM